MYLRFDLTGDSKLGHCPLHPVPHWLRIVPESFKSQTQPGTFKQRSRDVQVLEGTVSTAHRPLQLQANSGLTGLELGSRAYAAVLNFTPIKHVLC